ncbi:MAG: FHA domain-containing protein [Oscillatoriales cyanobacterium SM2_1_8]|nr:FHA domain-containing protein [Oscillatoriales cyanobacterium SM2_1_8]
MGDTSSGTLLQGLLRAIAPNQPRSLLPRVALDPPTFLLPHDRSILLGRDPGCHVAVDAEAYPIVSRHHALLEPLREFGTILGWRAIDRQSANGTLINGKPIRVWDLHSGDRLQLGQDGPEFLYTCVSGDSPTQIEKPQPRTPPQG